MKVPFVDLRAQDAPIRTRLADSVQRVADRCNFVLGEEVDAFEMAFAEYVGAGHAIGVSSGLAALELILRGYDIGPGDEVIVPAHTFVATAASVALVGATPTCADVDDTFNVDPASVEAAITSRTKAIIAVHLYGRPAAMDELLAIAARHGLKLIEDAAQAHGAELGGRRTGSLADAAAFSFYPSKNLGASGDAGAVTTDDGELADRIRALRNCGQHEKNLHSLMPCNHRMDTLQAAVLSVRLERLDAWNAARRNAASWYFEELADAPVTLPPGDDGTERSSVWHLFVIQAPERERLRQALAAADIGVGIHYPMPVHRQPVFLSLGYEEGSFPVAESYCRTILSLPMHPSLEREQVAHVASIVRENVASVAS